MSLSYVIYIGNVSTGERGPFIMLINLLNVTQFRKKYGFTETIFILSMTGKYKETVTDRELLTRVLNTISESGEVIESELYRLSGSRLRIPRLLSELVGCGALETRIRDEGQKVPVYSLTPKGELLRLVNRFENQLMQKDGTLDMDSFEVREICTNLARHFDAKCE